MMRALLFLLTNFSVIIILGLLLNQIGIRSSNIQDILMSVLFFGFFGSFVFLFISKKIALKSVGGEIIKEASNDIEYWLMDTVVQQARKTKISVPKIATYNAQEINAFSIGAHRNFSLIAVSTGMLKNMSLHEVEAVIAHEISHIANGDMVTMTLIQGVVNTFVIFIARIITWAITCFFIKNQNKEREDTKNININNLIYLSIITMLKLIFGILANIIIMCFSRYREFRADAGSAKLVGCEKIIAALQRLKTSQKLKEKTGLIATLYINGISRSLNILYITHPPLDKRIEALKNINII